MVDPGRCVEGEKEDPGCSRSEFRLTRFVRGLSRNRSMVPHYASGLARAALGDLQQDAQGLVDGGAVGECS